MHIARKMKVNILHRYDLCITAARGSALNTEHRAERRLPQSNDCLFPNLRHRLSETGCRRCFPLACRCRIDCRDKNQLSIFGALHSLKQRLIELRLVSPVRLKLLLLNSQLRGNGRDRLQLRLLGNFNIRQHSFLHPPFLRRERLAVSSARRCTPLPGRFDLLPDPEAGHTVPIIAQTTH